MLLARLAGKPAAAVPTIGQAGPLLCSRRHVRRGARQCAVDHQEQRPCEAAPAAAGPQGPAPSRILSASKELGPYLLWDRVTQLSACWDPRAHSEADLRAVCEVLKPHLVGDLSIAQEEGAEGQPLTRLTVTVRPEESDDVAAALLQWTPATGVTAAPAERCSLPQRVLAVNTPEHGPIDVRLSLAGSSLRKASPSWPQCQAAADRAAAARGGGAGPSAADVAAAAVERLSAGLADGSVQLDAHLLF